MNIIQGTTPTHFFDLPFSADMVAAARITYKQRDTIVLEKELADCVKNGDTLELTLTQKETLGFEPDISVVVQLHMVAQGGQALASEVMYATVKELLSGRVI